MKAIVYGGPGDKAWEDVPEPGIQDPADAIVKVECTTICGTDLHILKGDVPAVTEGRILGHERRGCDGGRAVVHQGDSRRPGDHLVHQQVYGV